MAEFYYNILWIDDEYESLKGTKGRAKRNGINLIPFKSLNAGMDELERNYLFYDGVLLDAKFFENEDDIRGSEDTFNVHRAKERILGLKPQKKFEVFVLTGQSEAFGDTTFNKAFPKVYKKGIDDEIDRLFKDIKDAADRQEDTQIRYQYKRVFDVCTDKYIGELAGHDILSLLKVYNNDNIDAHFNTIRKIVEDLFVSFNKFELLPIEFIENGVSINESSRFLAGKHSNGSYFIEKEYKHLDGTHLPEQIAYYLRNIIAVTQPGSHRSEIDLYVRTVKTSYLLKSVFYQLLDLLVWFKMYVDGNPTTKNWVKENFETKDISSFSDMAYGEVFNLDIQKGYAFFKPDVSGENVFIPPYLVSKHSLKESMRIQVEIEEYTDNRTNQIKVRVKSIELL